MTAAVDLCRFVKPQLWECRLCGGTDQTTEAQPHTRFHACPAMGGLTTPMVPAGQKCDVRVHEREDYVGGEDVQYANGRPITAIETVRDDGNDVAVYAPTAHGGIG